MRIRNTQIEYVPDVSGGAGWIMFRDDGDSAVVVFDLSSRLYYGYAAEIYETRARGEGCNNLVVDAFGVTDLELEYCASRALRPEERDAIRRIAEEQGLAYNPG